MKRIFLPLTLLFAFLAGCSTALPSEPASTETIAVPPTFVATGVAAIPAATVAVRPALDVSFENALAPRLLLSLGTLKLAETPMPVTPEQTPQLLMLWQALDNLTQSGTSAQAEVDALLAQIESVYTPEQIMAINAMRLTQVELQAWAQQKEVAAASGGGGQGQGQGQGGGSGMSSEARATKQAAQGVTASGGDNGLSDAVTQALLAYLQTIQP